MATRKARPAAARADERWSPLLPAEDLASARDYTMRTGLWRWKGGSWHFVTVPKKLATEIRRTFGSGARGFGSIRVRATLGDTQWQTSLFPDRKAGTYLMPVKGSVRKAEDIGDGDRVTVQLHVL